MYQYIESNTKDFFETWLMSEAGRSGAPEARSGGNAAWSANEEGEKNPAHGGMNKNAAMASGQPTELSQGQPQYRWIFPDGDCDYKMLRLADANILPWLDLLRILPICPLKGRSCSRAENWHLPCRHAVGHIARRASLISDNATRMCLAQNGDRVAAILFIMWMNAPIAAIAMADLIA